MELVTIEIGDVKRKFAMPVEVTKVDKGELLFLDNRNYEETIAKNPHLSGVFMNDRDKKSHLPVHLILGAGEYAKLRTESAPKIGEPGEPVAELSKFGWITMSPGNETSGHKKHAIDADITRGLLGTLPSTCARPVRHAHERPEKRVHRISRAAYSR